MIDKNTTITDENKNNWPIISSTFEIASKQTGTLECDVVTPFLRADHVEVALWYIVFTDDTIYYVPEADLRWFSSKAGEFISSSRPYTYEYPNQEIFDKSRSFMFGINYLNIYPEYLNLYNLSDAGSIIMELQEDSIFKQLGAEEGDIITSCDGVSYLEDTYFIERGKARILDGSSVDFVLSRNGEKYTITITPEMVEGTIDGK